jgi:hypothetical protein
MNDEAHHAYRRGIEEEDEYALDEETAEANAREAGLALEAQRREADEKVRMRKAKQMAAKRRLKLSK